MAAAPFTEPGPLVLGMDSLVCALNVAFFYHFYYLCELPIDVWFECYPLGLGNAAHPPWEHLRI